MGGATFEVGDWNINNIVGDWFEVFKDGYVRECAVRCAFYEPVTSHQPPAMPLFHRFVLSFSYSQLRILRCRRFVGTYVFCTCTCSGFGITGGLRFSDFLIDSKIWHYIALTNNNMK
jgi:hypothetical protein